MIKIMNIENTEIKDILTRDINLETGVEDIVSGVISNVKENGDKALFEYAVLNYYGYRAYECSIS